MTDRDRLAFIGGGNMAAALIAGLVKRGLPRDSIVVADPDAARLRLLERDFGIVAAADNERAAAAAEVVILAVKPQQLEAVSRSIAPHLKTDTLVVSIAAGIPHAALARWLGAEVAIVRTMPNRPAFEGMGATGLYAPPAVGADHRARAQTIMAAVGATAWVEQEAQLDAVTALSGSGPAYFFLFMEALEEAAHALGLPREIAHRFTLETALGAATMALRPGESLPVLREQVTSKGGTTAAALAVLDAADLRGIVARAVEAAGRRSAELAAEYGSPQPAE